MTRDTKLVCTRLGCLCRVHADCCGGFTRKDLLERSAHRVIPVSQSAGRDFFRYSWHGTARNMRLHRCTLDCFTLRCT